MNQEEVLVLLLLLGQTLVLDRARQGQQALVRVLTQDLDQIQSQEGQRDLDLVQQRKQAVVRVPARNPERALPLPPDRKLHRVRVRRQA